MRAFLEIKDGAKLRREVHYLGEDADAIKRLPLVLPQTPVALKLEVIVGAGTPAGWDNRGSPVTWHKSLAKAPVPSMTPRTIKQAGPFCQIPPIFPRSQLASVDHKK